MRRGPTSNFDDYLNNEILIHMPMLHTFKFHLTSEHQIDDEDFQIPDTNSVQMLTNVKHCEQVAYTVDYPDNSEKVHRVFSLPFKFWLLRDISNLIPSMTFNSVTHLRLRAFKRYTYKFFFELNQTFPVMENLYIWNGYFPIWELRGEPHDKDWVSIVKYSHLISLDMENTNHFYVDDFLNERKTSLPRLTRLKIRYSYLEYVTKKFTKAETKRNCSKIKRLEIGESIVYSKDLYDYFPSL
jgi:hypothetical protein